MPSSTATLIGFAAILLWSLLSLLTVASGTVPPFQLAAMTFAVAGTMGAATWIFLPRAAPCTARRGAARQLSLAGADRAAVIASARRALSAASFCRRDDRARRHGAAVLEPRRHHVRASLPAGLCGGLHRGFHLGDLFGDVAPPCGGTDRRGGGLLPRDRDAGGDLSFGVGADAVAANARA